MNERIIRKDDEHVYQPRLRSEWVRKLWQIKQETGIPMTALLESAVREFVETYRANKEEVEK